MATNHYDIDKLILKLLNSYKSTEGEKEMEDREPHTEQSAVCAHGVLPKDLAQDVERYLKQGYKPIGTVFQTFLGGFHILMTK